MLQTIPQPASLDFQHQDPAEEVDELSFHLSSSISRTTGCFKITKWLLFLSWYLQTLACGYLHAQVIEAGPPPVSGLLQSSRAQEPGEKTWPHTLMFL